MIIKRERQPPFSVGISIVTHVFVNISVVLLLKQKSKIFFALISSKSFSLLFSFQLLLPPLLNLITTLYQSLSLLSPLKIFLLISCGQTIHYGDLKRIVDQDTLQKYDRFALLACLKNDPTTRWCPNPECEMAYTGLESSSYF